MLAQAQLLRATRAERNRALPKTANPQKLQLRPDPSQVESPRKKKPQLHMQRDSEKQLCANDSWVRASGFGYICMGRGGPAVPKRPLGTTLQWLQRGGGAGWSPVHLASHGGAVGSKPMKLTFCRLILELWGTGEDSALGLPPMAGRGGRSFLLLHARSFKARATDRRGWHVGEVSPARSRAHVQHMAASAVM